MRCSHCGICCANTEMLLSEDDIRLLERTGHKREEFTSYNREGFATLKNFQGYCVFYNVEARHCSVYKQRPLGCRIYPVVYDEERGVICDSLCPLGDTVTKTEVNRKTIELLNLLRILEREATGRLSRR